MISECVFFFDEFRPIPYTTYSSDDMRYGNMLMSAQDAPLGHEQGKEEALEDDEQSQSDDDDDDDDDISYITRKTFQNVNDL